jgi:ubiquinone/menaquinone biosynthesis C-methylase UbiE
MDNQLQAIRDQQLESWNRFSGGWKKWNDFTMEFLKPMGEAIIQGLDIKDEDIILDIASGTGEPALTIAGLAKNGKVYATDLADHMLDIAKENAAKYNIENIVFRVADISELPFSNNFFDKVSCRMGFMFFPDMQLAANEMFRVCKSGGRVATSVWALPENNEWVTTIMKVLSKNMEIPQPPPGSPGMFRCSKPGIIKEFFENAGFTEVKEETISGKTGYGSTDEYWQSMNDLAAPVVGALAKADDATKGKIKEELYEACNNMLADGKLIMNYSSTIISGLN